MKTNILKKLIKEEIKNVLREGDNEHQNYMFFQNLQTIKRMAEKMLALNPQEVDALLSNGHGWAVDHISTAADDVGEVGTWLCNMMAQRSNPMMNEDKQSNDWNTVYDWVKINSSDNEEFLNKHNITSGHWLMTDLKRGKITPEDIDAVTYFSESNLRFSELPMVQRLLKSINTTTN